jgi:hypothetical protein
MKEGSFRKNWKVRYFRLSKEGRLRYYENHYSALDAPIKEQPLSFLSRVEVMAEGATPKPFGFCLVGGGGVAGEGGGAASERVVKRGKDGRVVSSVVTKGAGGRRGSTSVTRLIMSAKDAEERDLWVAAIEGAIAFLRAAKDEEAEAAAAAEAAEAAEAAAAAAEAERSGGGEGGEGAGGGEPKKGGCGIQ